VGIGKITEEAAAFRDPPVFSDKKRFAAGRIHAVVLYFGLMLGEKRR
jgi:hypothetical protein